jgi:hypothetical protein
MMSGNGAPETVIEQEALPDCPALSVAVAVKVEVPPAVGVPLIAPVAGFRLNPAGRLPDTRKLNDGAVISPTPMAEL